MTTAAVTERIRGRLVTIEVGQVPGDGWIAVGIVEQGPAPDRGARFEARGAERREAVERLRAEIEAAFA
jgi:hypothetical protein